MVPDFIKEDYRFYKTGEYVTINGTKYLFLGYSDYKRTECVVATMDGEKIKMSAVYKPISKYK